MFFDFLLDDLDLWKLFFISIGVIAYAIFLVFDTQRMANGKKHDLNCEEYVVGSLLIHFDIVAYPIEFLLTPERQ